MPVKRHAELHQPGLHQLTVFLGPAALVMAALFALPLLAVVSLSLTGANGGPSLEWYTRFVQSAYRGDLLFTFGIALCVSGMCGVLSIPLSYFLLRSGSGWLSSAVRAALMAPIVVPHIIAGYAMWLALSNHGPIVSLLKDHLGMFDDVPNLTGNWKGLVIALVWKFFPITTLTTLSALGAVDEEYRLAARDLGAGPWSLFSKIDLPLIMPGLVAGCSMVFVLASSQFSIALVMNAGSTINTIPVGIYYETFGLNRWNYGAALGLILTVVTMATLLLSTKLSRVRP